MKTDTSQLNTSTNGIHPPEGTQSAIFPQVGVNELTQHMAAIADKVSDMPSPVQLGKLGNADFYAYYNNLLAEAELRITDQVEDPFPCLEIVNNGQSITFGTLGNFFIITGKAKSRKTFLLSIITAALLKQDTVLNSVRGQLPVDKQTILYFDTEQIGGHLMRVLKRLSALSGDEMLVNLRAIRLRKYSTADRINAIRVAIEQTPNLGAIIIDGIKDTVFDINDAKEATERATDLLQWTEENGAHLVAIIHENKANSNARGHLGTELINKAETVISVSLDPNDKKVSIVTAEYCRDKEFEPFGFSVDENGLPFMTDEVSSTQASANRSKKPTADSMTPDQIAAIIKRVFESEEALRYSQLVTNVIEASEFIGIPLAKSRAETFIPRVVKSGYLKKGKHKPSDRYESYQLNVDSPLF